MRLTPPDLELFLTGYVRACAAADQVDVSVGNKEPSKLTLPVKKPVIVIRDDSGNRKDLPTFDRSIGATVLAGSTLNDKPAKDLARWLIAVLMDDAIIEAAGSPIAGIDLTGWNGPYTVPDPLDVTRQYLTGGYTVVGTW